MIPRALKWLGLAVAGVAVAFALERLNDTSPNSPMHGFRSGYIWALATAWVVLMISAIFVERRR